jgi:hypothetical protein
MPTSFLDRHFVDRRKQEYVRGVAAGHRSGTIHTSGAIKPGALCRVEICLGDPPATISAQH